jgi:hypothetical protein
MPFWQRYLRDTVKLIWKLPWSSEIKIWSWDAEPRIAVLARANRYGSRKWTMLSERTSLRVVGISYINIGRDAFGWKFDLTCTVVHIVRLVLFCLESAWLLCGSPPPPSPLLSMKACSRIHIDFSCVITIDNEWRILGWNKQRVVICL